MAETLWVSTSGHITGDCPSPANAEDEWNATWAGPTTNNVAWTSRWAIDDPSGALAGTQQITVRVRKTAQSTDPSVQVNLYESGALVQSLISTTAVSSEVDLSGEFDGSVITNSADVEVEVVATVGGGSPGNRASLQLDGIRFVAEVAAAVTTTVTLDGTLPTLIGSFDVDAAANMAFAGTLPPLTGSFDATATAEVGMAGTLPPLAGDFTVDEGGGGGMAVSNVRAFDGTDDFITLGIGNIVNSGAVTMLVLCNRTAGDGWRSTIDVSSGTTQRTGMQVNQSAGNTITYISGGNFPTTNVAWGTAEGWVIVGISKASGTAAVRGHKYVLSTDTWTRDNGSSIANSTQGDTVRLGEMASFGEFFVGRIALAAVWSRAMSDAEMDGLVADAQSWLDATPNAMWLLTQDATTTDVEDVTGGGADQTAITGTSVVTDDPPGFDLTLGGGATDVTLVGTLPALTGSFDVTTSADVGLSGTLPALDGSLTVDASADVTLAGTLPALTGSFQIVETDLSTVTLDGVLPALTGSFDTDATAQAALAGTLSSLTGSFEIDAGGEPVPPSFISVVVGPLRDPLQVDEMREPVLVGAASGELVMVGALRDTAPTIGELRDEQSPTIGELRDPLAVDEMRDPLTVDELKE